MEEGSESGDFVRSDLSGNKIESTQLEEAYEQLQVRIKGLEKKIQNFLANNQALEEYLKERKKMRNNLVENQNIADNVQTVMKDEITLLEESLIDLQEDQKKLEKIFNDEILKQEIVRYNLERLRKESIDENLNREKELTKLVKLKDTELLETEIRCGQLLNKVKQIDQLLCEKNSEIEKNKKAIQLDELKHKEKTTKLSECLTEIEFNLTSVRKENSKLKMEIDNESKKYEQHLSNYDALKAASEKHIDQITHLESRIEETKGRLAKKQEKLDELNKTLSITVLERESKIEDYRRQRQDLEQNITELTAKLVEINSTNQNLSDIKAKRDQFIDEIMEKIQSQDDELRKLSENVQKSTDLKNELSTKSGTISENLINKQKQLTQIKTELEAHNDKEDIIAESEFELRAKLNITKQLLRDKIDEVTKFHEQTQNEKVRLSEKIERLKQDLDQKDHQLTEITINNQNILKDAERFESESNKKLQQIQENIKDYENQSKKQSTEIDDLREQLEAEKLKNQHENQMRAEIDQKQEQEQESQLKEMESLIANTEKQITVLNCEKEELAKKLQKAKTFNTAGSKTRLNDSNASELMGVIYGKNASLPATSTPQNSPAQSQRAHLDFGFGSSSDLSSIGESHTDWEKAERLFNEYMNQNKTDNAKLYNSQAVKEVE